MDQSNFASIPTGARVVAGDTTIGTVERLDTQSGTQGDQPSQMIVRAEDGQQRYAIPLMLVDDIHQGTFYNEVRLKARPDEIAAYAAEPEDQAAAGMAAPATPSGEWTGSADGDTLRIPLAAEELVAEKQTIVRGKVHVHKGVETVQQDMTVPVYHEEAIVEHIPVDQYDPNAPAGPNDLIIPVTEEQIVVEKRSVVKEYIRIRKNVVMQEQHVSDVVRREYIEVTEQQADGANAGTAPLLHFADENAGATGATGTTNATNATQ